MSREPLPALPSPAARPVRRDVRPVIYLALDQLFALGYVYVIVAVIPNRLPSAAIHLWSIPVFTQITAVGMAAVFWPRARPIGWAIAVVGGSLVLLSTFVLIIRVLVSAAFLAGVYGAFGAAAASFALVAVALVIEVVALLPIAQIKYLMTRAGRHAFGRS